MTNGVYALSIWDEELKQTRGVLADDRVRIRLSEARFEGKYPPEAQRFIIEMMLSYELCYELPRVGNRRRYLVPNALPEDEPMFDFNAEGTLRFEIHFPRILPTSVISRFIVAMNEEAKEVWRFGLHGEKLGHAFKVTAHTKERVIRIAIAGNGPARIRVLEIIRNHFHVICRDREYNQKDYSFPPHHPNAQPYLFDSLLEAERAKQTTIWLPDGVGNVQVQEWLNGITNPTARKELQEAIKAAAEQGGRIIITDNYYEGDNMSGDRNLSIGGDANAPLNLGDDVIQGSNNTKAITTTSAF